MMLLAYSVLAFMVGVTTYVCTPLYADENDLGGREVSPEAMPQEEALLSPPGRNILSRMVYGWCRCFRLVLILGI